MLGSPALQFVKTNGSPVIQVKVPFTAASVSPIHARMSPLPFRLVIVAFSAKLLIVARWPITPRKLRVGAAAFAVVQAPGFLLP